MLRIKKNHLGKSVKKGTLEFNLTNDLSQKELKYIKLMVADDFVEEYTPKESKKKDSKENKDSVLNKKDNLDANS